MYININKKEALNINLRGNGSLEGGKVGEIACRKGRGML